MGLVCGLVKFYVLVKHFVSVLESVIDTSPGCLFWVLQYLDYCVYLLDIMCQVMLATLCQLINVSYV
jgi:hypothetical protein